jgi:hypothetical protein
MAGTDLQYDPSARAARFDRHVSRGIDGHTPRVGAAGSGACATGVGQTGCAGPADNGVRSAFIDQNVIYFSWPREVRWLCADSPHLQDELFGMSPASLAAVLFWDVTPPSNFPPGIRLGPKQVFIPLNQAPPNQ